MLTRLLHALFGVLATLAGVAAAHLVAALTVPAASPVLVVGSTVIDLTPTPVKEWAIKNFGTNDKPILIGSVMIGVLVLAAVAGIVAARWITAGLLMIVGLAGLAGVLALLRPSAGPSTCCPAWSPRSSESSPCGGCTESRRRAQRTVRRGARRVAAC